MLKYIALIVYLMLGGMAPMAATPADELFLRNEAQRSLYEAAFGRLGQTQATRPAVRTYAATLTNDHEAYNGALRDLAKSKGIALPSSMAAADKKRLDKLAGTHGEAFDDAFIQEAKRVNDGDLRNLRKAAGRTADPDIRGFVTRFLEVDERHEEGARALSERDEAARRSVIPPPRTGDTMAVPPPPEASTMPVIPAPK